MASPLNGVQSSTQASHARARWRTGQQSVGQAQNRRSGGNMTESGNRRVRAPSAKLPCARTFHRPARDAFADRLARSRNSGFGTRKRLPSELLPITTITAVVTGVCIVRQLVPYFTISELNRYTHVCVTRENKNYITTRIKISKYARGPVKFRSENKAPDSRWWLRRRINTLCNKIIKKFD